MLDQYIKNVNKVRDRYIVVQRLAGFSFYSAIIKSIWGALFIISPNTFSQAQAYKAMAALADEPTWGIVLTIIGLLHLLSIFMPKLITRIAMQIISIALWLFIATMFGISNPLSSGAWTYGFAAICDFIAIVYLLRFEKGGI